jgi:hypothetical protein
VSSPPQDSVCLQIPDSRITDVVLTTTDIKKKNLKCSVRVVTQRTVHLIKYCHKRQKIAVH